MSGLCFSTERTHHPVVFPLKASSKIHFFSLTTSAFTLPNRKIWVPNKSAYVLNWTPSFIFLTPVHINPWKGKKIKNKTKPWNIPSWLFWSPVSIHLSCYHNGTNPGLSSLRVFWTAIILWLPKSSRFGIICQPKRQLYQALGFSPLIRGLITQSDNSSNCLQNTNESVPRCHLSL